ncbi:MAG: hypothetical protein ACRDV9_00055 [Acidimicrobiia bacterium]
MATAPHGNSSRRRLLLLGLGVVTVLAFVATGAFRLPGIGKGGPSRLVTAERPGSSGAPLAIVSVVYEEILVGPGRRPRPYRLTHASDGSFRWSAADGVADVAYDASLGRAVEVFPGGSDSQSVDGSPGDGSAFVATDIPPGGPDRLVPVPPPLGSLADYVTALGRSSDPRVTASTFAERPTWQYDGPVKPGRRAAQSPDRATIQVDQESGVLLLAELTSRGEPFQRITATSVEEGETTDRSRFRREPKEGTDEAALPHGFAPRSLAEADRDVGYGLLVPSKIPEGFRLTSVTVDLEVASATGAGRKNPQAVRIATLQWRKGFWSFTVTLRPKGDGRWSDPFGAEGFDFDIEPIRLALAGRAPLVGELVLDAPARPHLWGTSGDVVVTVDGDLGAAELRSVAGSLRRLQA